MSDPALRLAEQVVQSARVLDVNLALIGAWAMALHGYDRTTSDLDFASAVDPYTVLRDLGTALDREGLHTNLMLPDEQDPLGGCLRVWEREDEDGEPIDPVDVVNFTNPHRAIRLPKIEMLRDAVPLPNQPAFRCVLLRHLIVLKMYAGDLADVVKLIEANPTADLEDIRGLCKRYGLDRIDEAIEQATRR